MPTLGNYHVLIDRHYSMTDLGSLIGTAPGATVSISVTHVHIGPSSDSASVPTHLDTYRADSILVPFSLVS